MPGYRSSFQPHGLPGARVWRWAWPLALLCAAALCAGCSHLYAYGNAAPDCNPVDSSGEAKPSSASSPKCDPDRPLKVFPDVAPPAQEATPPQFVGALPQALRDVDNLRLAQLKSVDEMTSERAAYNAALWTLTPFLLYRAINSSNQKLLVGGAAGLAAGYGYLSGESADIGRLHIATARKLACEMVASSEYLYTEEDYGRVADNGDSVDLPEQNRRLRRAIDEYSAGVAWLKGEVADLPSDSPARCAVEGSAACAQRRKAHPGPNQGSRLDAINQVASASLRDASQLLSQLEDLDYQIQQGAAQRLNADAQATMAQTVDQLWTHTSEVKSFTDALTSIKTAVDALLAKQTQTAAPGHSGERGTDSGRSIEPLRIPAAIRKRKYRPDIRGAEQELQQQVTRGQMFIFAQLERSDRTRTALDSQGCTASGVAPDLPKPAAQAGVQGSGGAAEEKTLPSAPSP